MSFCITHTLRKLSGCLFIAGILTGCNGSQVISPPSYTLPSSGSTIPESGSGSSEQVSSTISQDLRESKTSIWHRKIIRTELPSAGCYTASYPAIAWSKIPCADTKVVPTPPRARPIISSDTRLGSRPLIAGGGADYTLNSGAALISSATGSFPIVNGLSSVSSSGGSCTSGCSGANAYSVQLNSSFFTTSACNGQSNCFGWEQFVFQNIPSLNNASISMDSWLINASSCPAGYSRVSSNDCLTTAFGQSIPLQPITNLESMSITGSASSQGDSIIFTVGNTVYAKMYLLSDNLNYLSANWNDAEFNVMGSGNSSEAYFNAGSSIAISLKANDGTVLAPNCPGDSSFTGESNNLNYVTPPLPTILDAPSIALQETTGTPSAGSNLCSVSGISQVAFQGTTTDLYIYAGASRLSDTSQRVMPATSPSIAKLVTRATGGYEEAFQSTTGALTVSGDAGNITTTNLVAPGTSPSIAADPFSSGHYTVAFQDNKGYFDLYNTSGTLTDSRQSMAPRTSPSVALTPSGSGIEVALQSNTGVLVLYGPTSVTTTLPMMAGSSPSLAIAPNSGNILVAYEGADGILHTYSPSTGDTNTSNLLMPGTNPSVTALTTGGYEAAFQNASGSLVLTGVGGSGGLINSGMPMMKGTSPSIVAEPGGLFAEAIQTNSGSLMILSGNTTSNGNLNTAQMMAVGTSPSIAP